MTASAQVGVSAMTKSSRVKSSARPVAMSHFPVMFLGTTPSSAVTEMKIDFIERSGFAFGLKFMQGAASIEVKLNASLEPYAKSTLLVMVTAPAPLAASVAPRSTVIGPAPSLAPGANAKVAVSITRVGP